MSVTTFSLARGIVNTQEVLGCFQKNGFVILEEVLTSNEIKYYINFSIKIEKNRVIWLFCGTLLANTKPKIVTYL